MLYVRAMTEQELDRRRIIRRNGVGMRVAWVAAAAATFLLTGCSSNALSAGPLQNADSARASEAAAKAAHASFGQQFALGNLRITVSNPIAGGDSTQAYVTVTVKVDNPTSNDSNGFDPGIICSGDTDDGGYLANSTLDVESGFPARSTDVGTLLLLPSSGNTTPPALCKAPAAIVFAPTETFNGKPASVRILLSDTVLASLNAILTAPTSAPS